MKCQFIPEPQLEFGGSQRHVDIRFGLMNHGPVDVDSKSRPAQINLALVGTNESLEGFADWIAKCRAGIPAKPDSKQPNLFPRFPGCDLDLGLRTVIEASSRMSRAVTKSEIAAVIAQTGFKNRTQAAVELLFDHCRQIVDDHPNASVLAVAVPIEIVNALDESAIAEIGGSDEEDHEVDSLKPDYRDMLKARMMTLHKPIQVVRPSTYDESKQRMQKKRPDRPMSLQDEATRAWNIHTALYYKAGGVPWRLVRDSSLLDACYVGISFYATVDKSSLRTSIAQVFNEKGEGVIVRGGSASVSKVDLQPHLAAKDAEELLVSALRRYKDIHKNLPARLVIHKSSSFNDAELEGFRSALGTYEIEHGDFLSLRPSKIRLSRIGDYPPLRGTMLSVSAQELVLYTKGSVQFFETWPGQFAPMPRMVRIAGAESTPRFLAEEVLALTKMNWNNTQFDGAEPITLRASREVSKVLRFCPDEVIPETRYSYYM